MPENTKDNDTRPTRSTEPDLDFRTRLTASRDVSEYKRANRSLHIIDGVTISGLLGRFGFWRWVHLSFSGHALPAGCGGSHLRLIGSRNCPASAQSTRIRHQFPRNFLPKRTIFYKRRSDPRNTNVSVFVPRENPSYGKATDQSRPDGAAACVSRVLLSISQADTCQGNHFWLVLA
jgi:hypothetical protein